MSTSKLETRENLRGRHAPDDFDADGSYRYPGDVLMQTQERLFAA